MPSADERAQRVARHDAAHAVAGREVLLGAEEIAGLQPLLEQIVAHLRDDLRGQRCRAAGDVRTVCRRGGGASLSIGAPSQPRGTEPNDRKDIIFKNTGLKRD